jgi:hypothetical protein
MDGPAMGYESGHTDEIPKEDIMARRRMTALTVVLAMALFAGCGGSSGTGDGGGDAATTRSVQGTIGGAAAQVLDASKEGAADSCTAIDPAICKVIALATDGSTVYDDTLSDCTFSLPLVIGSDYVISFVGLADDGTCSRFVATLIAGGESVFSIEAGNDVLLGTITIDPATGQATASEMASYEDMLIGCAELGVMDSDGDSICDTWDDMMDDEGSSEPGDDGEPSAMEALEGTYVVSTVTTKGVGGTGKLFAPCAGKEDAFAYSIDVAVTDDKVSLVDAPQAPYLFNNDETKGTWSDAIAFNEVAGGYEATGIFLDSGCPLYDSTSDFAFDTSVSPYTLTRSITDFPIVDYESCKAIYQKQ